MAGAMGDLLLLQQAPRSVKFTTYLSAFFQLLESMSRHCPADAWQRARTQAHPCLSFR